MEKHVFQITQESIDFAWMVNITLTVVGLVAAAVGFWLKHSMKK